MQDKIWLSSPHMGGTEQKYVQEAFDTNWVAPLGPNVNGLENDLASFLKEGHVAAVSSGTAAIHLALILLGVGAGDEVLCQSMTFSATANPIAYLGAHPVFIDSEPDTWNMNPECLEQALKDRVKKGKKPKAIIPVHLYGMPAKMKRIMELAREYEVPVIEDAAEALGASIGKQRCGTFGALAVLSFNGNKIITTSGGGALVAKNPATIQKAVFLATQARDPAPHYQHSEIGYNYRMSNIVAGIGRGQMEVLEERVGQRRANFDYYKKAFAGNNAISFQEAPEGFFSNRWLTAILVDPKQSGGITREDIRLALEKDNIESRPLWKPMHLQPVFDGNPFYGEGVSDSLFERGLCLPSGSNLSQEDLQRVTAIVTAVMKGMR